jgi:N-acetylmuramoyl-L-alanine amidase
MKICIDPGHGGYDSGAVGNGLKEKDITLKIALKVRDFLKDVCDIILTRDSDNTAWNSNTDLQTRCDIANKANADYFISIHVNSASGTAGTGFESYVSAIASQQSKNLGQKIHDDLANFYKNKGFTDRGFKTANFYVLNNTNMPATLIENLFINNPDDAKFLTDDNFINDFSSAIANALKNALGIITRVTQKTAIMGQATASAEQMEAYLHAVNPNAPYFATMYLEEGYAEGVRGDLAFAQSIKETGYFKFGGDVKPEQNNFAGLGATGGGAQGATFPDARTGIRAQIQHLKAYASTEALKNPCVDPRFNLVTRGIAPYWEDLDGKWAVPGDGYGESIVKIWQDICNTKVQAQTVSIDDYNKLKTSYDDLLNKINQIKNILGGN